MSPSTTRPQDAFKRPKRTWICYLCQPNVQDGGGQREWMAHYMREHFKPVNPKETS